MSFPVNQPIQVGAATIFVGDSPTDNWADAAVGNVDASANSPAQFAATDKVITVDSGDGAILAPDVADVGGSPVGVVADPPICNVIYHVKSGEGMICWKRDGDDLYVIRGVSLHWMKYDIDNSQRNGIILDGEELQLAGKFTFPTKTTAKITAEDVVITITHPNFTPMDNQKGKDQAITSEAADNNMTVNFPRNTLAHTMKEIGMPGMTDGGTDAVKDWYTEPGRVPAGIVLPKKFLVVVPNDVFFNPETVSLGGSDHLDITKCYILPVAQFNLEATRTMSNSSQSNLAATFLIAYDDVWQKPMHFGGPSELMRITEII